MVFGNSVVLAMSFLLSSCALMGMQDQKEFKKVIIPQLKTRRSGSLILQHEPVTPRSPRVTNALVQSPKHPSSAPTTSRDQDRSQEPLVKEPQSPKSKMIDTLGLSPRSSVPSRKEGYRSPLSTRGRSTSTHERDMYSGSDDESQDVYKDDDIFKDYQAVDIQKLSDNIQKIIIAKQYYQERITILDKKLSALVQTFSQK